MIVQTISCRLSRADYQFIVLNTVIHESVQ